MNQKLKYYNVDNLKPVIEDYKKWGIHQLYNDHKEFTKDITWKTIDLIFEQNSLKQIKELIAKTYYNEKIRLKTDPYKIDPKDEKSFWGSVKKRLTRISIGESIDEENDLKVLVEEIIHRYANEILGGFKYKTYKFAQRMIPTLLRRLLNSASARNLGRFYSNKYVLSERLFYAGHIDLIRSIAAKTTLVFVPTHFSNLDSMLVGWTINSIGVPPVTYGAGLNLFKTRILAHYISRLGAYKLDRRKKNDLYLHTLKMYSQRLIEENCNSLFFPGGTRARSGALETRFKLGLLGTVVEAQFENCKKGNADFTKIVLVPTTINYYFVLEAKQLIEQHLKKSGKEKYYLNNEDDIKGISTVIKYIWNFFSTSSQTAVTFGQPIDVFGNRINENLESIDKHGRIADIAAYFKKEGAFVKDSQRNMTYTQFLGNHILQEFRRGTIVFTSQLVAFVAYQMIKRMHPKLDLYDLLRLPQDDRIIPYEDFSQHIYVLVQHIKTVAEKGEILIDPHVLKTVDEVIEHGIKNLGAYHNKRPLKITDNGLLTSENMNLLYYYHNRLTGFEFEQHIS